MVCFHTILVPVDFSRYSDAALKYAVSLAHGIGSEVIVLHVQEPLLPTTAYVTPMGGYAEPYMERLDEARAALDAREHLVKGVRHRLLVKTGVPGDEILSVARQTGADIIIMATHGRTGVARLLMGSTAESVMRQTDLPVMTLRAGWLVPETQPAEPTAAAAN